MIDVEQNKFAFTMSCEKTRLHDSQMTKPKVKSRNFENVVRIMFYALCKASNAMVCRGGLP